MTTFTLTDNASDFTTCHNSVILDPNKKYEAALLSLNNYSPFQILLKKKIMCSHIRQMMEKPGKPLLLILVLMN